MSATVLFKNNLVEDYLRYIRYRNPVKYGSLHFETMSDIMQAGFSNGVKVLLDKEYKADKNEYDSEYPNTKFLLVKDYPCNTLSNYLSYSLSSKKIIKDYVISYNNGKICGILISEKGECKEHPKIWTIRLICNYSPSIHSECVGLGTSLIGLYLTCLKHISQPYGLLELAYGYNNLPAFCAYSKFNFVAVPQYACKTFSTSNVKMLSDITSFSKIDIANIVTGDLVLKKPLICRIKGANVLEKVQYFMNEDYRKKSKKKKKKIKNKSKK